MQGSSVVDHYFKSRLSRGSHPGQLTAICTAVAVFYYDVRLGELDQSTREKIHQTIIWEEQWWDWNRDRVESLRSKMESLRYAPAQTNKILAVVRSLLKSCLELDIIEPEQLAKVRSVPRVKGPTPRRDTGFSYGEMALLLNACADGTKSGVHEAALFSVGNACGCRVSEVANLRFPRDFNVDTGALTIRRRNGKTRVVFLTGGAKKHLLDWIEIRGNHAGPLWAKIRKDDLLNGDGLSPWSIGDRLDKRRRKAGLDKITWHTFGAALAGDLIDKGDLAAAQLILGHASPLTTMRYARRGSIEDIVRGAARIRPTPYRPCRK